MTAQATLASLHVESLGRGPPLVLLHGWALHGGLFAPIAGAFAEEHRVHGVDLPGHGHSDPLRPWTLDAVVESLEGHFAMAGAIKVLGWSLGGAIALAWARRHPSRISRLLLVAATPKFVAGPDWPHAMTDATLARFADELRVAPRLTLLRFLSLQVQGSDEGRAVLAGLRQQLHARGEPDPGVLSDALEALRGIDLRSDVRAIHQPALVVTGARDTLAPAGAGAWLANALPSGRLHALEGAAHAPFLSHRTAFLDVAVPFLRDD